MLQLDVGTCVRPRTIRWRGSTPIRAHQEHSLQGLAPGTAAEGKGYRVLFGEGDSSVGQIFEAAESVGGVEYYLIEQEGSRYPEIETAQRCLATWKQMRG